MTTSLRADLVEQYWREGYVHRVPVLSADEAASYLARFEAIEAEQIAIHGGPWKQRDYRPWDHADHPLRTWLEELASHPAILDAVESVLGPDLLVRNCDIFVKEPGIQRGIGWHLDTAVKEPDTDNLLTVWLGLTPATRENGSLLFSAGSHRLDIPGGPKDRYTLTLTKEAAAHLDPARTVVNAMDPGMASLHHFNLVHASGPNRTPQRRVAFVGRYMAPRISAATAESGVATLVRGTDSFGHFTLRERFPMSYTG